MSDMELYSRYFSVGKKVGVGIPLPNSDVFKDWAIIHKIDEDLVSLQLSRDVLPVDVTLRYGQILELRGGSENNGYCCRAIVVSEGDANELLLRLIGEVVSDELREFYRIDAFLPIKYFVSHEQNVDRLKKEWEERRALRLQPDTTDQNWIGGRLPVAAQFPHERHPAPDKTGSADSADMVSELSSMEYGAADSWDSVIPLAANISGGGLRVITHYAFENGEYVLLEILVPSPRRVIDVIGRVVFSNRNHVAGNDHEYYNTGVQFVYLDERDRDAIVNYIATIQLKRIRQLRERYLFRGALEVDEQFDTAGRSGVKRTIIRRVLLALFVVLLALLGNYFWYYAHEHPKGEIQRTFEEGVKQYREQQKPN